MVVVTVETFLQFTNAIGLSW